MAVILAANNKGMASMLLYTLAINTKLQAIIFLPILLLLLLQSEKYSFKSVFQIISICLALQFLLLLPFILAGNATRFLNVISGATEIYPHVTNSAHNIWWYLLLLNKVPYKIPDNETFYILNYRQVGYLMFFTISAFVLLPLLLTVVRTRAKNQFDRDKTIELAMLTSGIIALLFFFVNTQMHERYSHPMMIFFFFYGVYSKKYWLYLLSSFCYLLNMDMDTHSFLPINYSLWVFNVSANVLYFSILLAWSIIVLYKDFFWLRSSGNVVIDQCDQFVPSLDHTA